MASTVVDRVNRNRRIVVGALVLAAFLTGCAARSRGPAAGGIRLSQPVRFEGPSGELAFELRPANGTVEARDGGGRTLTIFRLREGGIEIEDIQERALARAVPPSGERSFSVFDAAGTTLQVSLHPEPDGDIEVTDGAGGGLYKLKKRSYGFKVVLASGEVESRVRVGERKVSIRDREGVTFLSTRDPFSAAAAAVLSLERVPFDWAAGLALAVTHWGSPGLDGGAR